MSSYERRFTVRLLPNKQQEHYFFDVANGCRHAYNWCLARQRDEYNTNKKKLNVSDLFQEFKNYKYTKPWLMRLPQRCLNQEVRALEKTYSAFFKRIKKDQKPSKFHFRSRKKTPPSFDVTDNAYFIKDDRGFLCVNIPILGLVRVQLDWSKYNIDYLLRLSRSAQIKLIGEPKVKYYGKKWCLTFTLKRESQAVALGNYSMGIDLGIRKQAVATISGQDFMHFKNINKSSRVKHLKRQLKRAQRKISRAYEKNNKRWSQRKYRRTNNINRLRLREKQLYKKLSNIRKDYIHKITRKLVDLKPSRVVMEDLKVTNMMKRSKSTARSIQEMLWYEFRKQIEYKCEELQIPIIFAPTFYPSSKNCSCCGNHKKNLGQGDKIYKCNVCGLVIDRDENAAINLMTYQPHK